MNLNLSLHKKQGAVLLSKATEILYGGAAGGGKSHLMRIYAIIMCMLVPGIQVYIFRRHYSDLYKNHMEGAGSFPMLLGALINSGFCSIIKNEINFKNGSKIHLCHLQYEKDLTKYQGAEIHILLMDELTHFTEKMYRFLRGRVRLGGLHIPDVELVQGIKVKARLPMVLCGSNPGGIGHNWVKRTFVDFCPAMGVVECDSVDGGMLRQYIPALLEDNPTLMENDPGYADKLSGLGDAALIKAMLTGDWNIVAGGALDDVWKPESIVLPRFKIPAGWRIDRTFDWGSSHPFSVGWWAEATGEEVELPDGQTLYLQPKSLIRISEWYGSKALGSNEGLKLSAPEIADGIVAREKLLHKEGWIQSKPKAGPADGQIYQVTQADVDTIAKKMADKGISWVKADKSPGSRVNGLELVRTALKASANGEGAGLYFMANCNAAISTLPTLPRDERRPEDVDTKAEDHIYDEVRYRVLAGANRAATSLNITLPV